MIITCENCGTRFNLDESLLDANGSTVRCSRCRHMFTAFPLPPEPEFDPLELDDSDADQTLEFDDSDFDEADDLTEDDSPESFDSEELELEAIDPDEIEIEIETADTVTAEEEEAETKSAEEPDLSKELDSGIKPGIMQKNEQFQEELGLDEIFLKTKNRISIWHLIWMKKNWRQKNWIGKVQRTEKPISVIQRRHPSWKTAVFSKKRP